MKQASLPTFRLLLTGIACSALFSWPTASLAQDAPADAAEESPAAEETREATTTADPEIDTSVLSAMLRPLTLAEVETELAGWLDLLKAKATVISEGEIAAAELSGDALLEQQEEQVELKTQRATIVERARLVAAEVMAKGGDPTEANLYIDQVASIAKPTGIASTIAIVKAWLISPEGGMKFGLNVLKFFGCLLAGLILGGLLSKILNASLLRVGKTSDLLRSFLVKTIRRLVTFVGLVIGLSFLGINIGPLLAAIGAAGLVVGLALQGTLSNFASGLLILFYKPFDVGDVVSAGGITGKVSSMTLVNTVFKTPDNQEVIVPNTKIWDDVITNVTASDTRRIDLVVGISYDDDIDKARKVLEEIVSGHEKVLDEPAPQIAVSELGDSSVNLVVRPWAKTEDYWDVRFGLTQAIKQRFDAEGLNFPFPQQDVHMFTVEKNAGDGGEDKKA